MTTQDALERPPAVGDAFAMDGAAVTQALMVDPARGLSEDEAVRRRARVGDNTVPAEPPRSLVHSVLAELRETMILVLLAAAVLTAVTGDLADCAVILLVIVVNTAVGVAQERRAVGCPPWWRWPSPVAPGGWRCAGRSSVRCPQWRRSAR